MTRPVLAGVDGSPESDAAVHWAAEEAARRGLPLRLVHAWPWLSKVREADAHHGDLKTTALSMLARTEDEVRRRHPQLALDTDLVLDEAVDALVSAAVDGELLVLGSRGLGGFAGLLVGSVGLATAARADIPVVLVRGDATDHDGAATGEVVVGLDARAPADPVLEFAFAEAALRGARLRAVHGWDLPPVFSYAGWVPPQLETAELGALEAKLLSQALLDWREKFPDTEVIEDVRLGGAAKALVDASHEARLVVVGRRARAHHLGMRLGPVTHAVIHHANAPTAVVPHL